MRIGRVAVQNVCWFGALCSDAAQAVARTAPVRRSKEDNVRSSHSLVQRIDVRRSLAQAPAWVAVLVAAAMTATLHGQMKLVENADGMDAPVVPVNPAAKQIEQELRMGGNYLAGKGVPKDPAQAAYWFRKAADLGDPGAQNELGYFYVWGIGVEQSQEQAFRWFARAAGGGWQQAKLNMAVMYMKGMGVARDPKFAAQLLGELAAKRNARAEDYLGLMYLDGYGVEQDIRAAEEWFSRSAKEKNPEGEFAMGQLYSVGPYHEHDFAKAAKFLRDSARGGYVPAMYTLGILLWEHPEAAGKRSDEAVSWLERAAEAGTWQSSVALGTMALNGQGTRQDLGEAFRWFTIAAKQGGAVAEERMRANLATCRAALAAGEQDEQRREAESWMELHPHTDLFVSKSAHSEVPAGEVFVMRASGME